MKINISTFGCKVNQYESEAILEMLLKKGYTKEHDFKQADIILINSCTVTNESDKKIKKFLHRVRRENPNAIIVLTGCMTQAASLEDLSLIDADIILGNTERKLIPEIILEFIENKEKIIKINPYKSSTKFEDLQIDNFDERTRAFVKIEDGCNRFCSYCIIPYARGRVRSKPLEDLINESKKLALAGYKEIVLIGINLSAYGQDINLTLSDAIEAVCKIDGIERVRLGSLEPEQMDINTIKRLSKQEKLCPQFHLSLQSGCDETLKRMNRHYNTDEYRTIVTNLREYFKNAAITTDIMVGFAGETEEEFKQSLNFAKEIGFSKIHVFPYSVRPGTRAANFNNQVNSNVKKERTKEMIKLGNAMHLSFLNSFIGKTEEVLLEKRKEDGTLEGYTKNYAPVKVSTSLNLTGSIVKIKITDVQEESCIGELI